MTSESNEIEVTTVNTVHVTNTLDEAQVYISGLNIRTEKRKKVKGSLENSNQLQAQQAHRVLYACVNAFWELDSGCHALERATKL